MTTRLFRVVVSFALAWLVMAGAGCGFDPAAGLGADYAAPASAPLTYVAIGASDSVGVGADRPEVEGWVPRLAARLPSGTRLINLGVNGSLLADALRQQAPVAVGSNPNLVTVWLAVNDFNARVPLPRYEADLNALLGQLASTGARVYIANIPDLTLVPVYDQMGISRPELVTAVAAWNTAIARAAEAHGARLVDVHALWPELAEHPEYIARDGFHPSAEGYRRLADIFWSVIAPDLATG